MQQEMKNEIFSLYVRCSFISPLKEEVDTSPENKILLLKVSFREKKNDAILDHYLKQIPTISKERKKICVLQ